MEYSHRFSRLRVQGTDSGRSTGTFPYMQVFSILGDSLSNSRICYFRFFLSFFIAAEGSFRGWQPLCYKQPPVFTRKLQIKVSSILQILMKSTLFVKNTATPVTMIRRVLYPLLNIRFYYSEKLRNCYPIWIHSVSTINTWTVYIPCSSTDSAEKLLQRVEMCLTMCKEQSILTKETEEWTKCRVLQKRGS